MAEVLLEVLLEVPLETCTSQPLSCCEGFIKASPGLYLVVTVAALTEQSDNMETCQLKSDHSAHLLPASPLHSKWKHGSMRTNYFQVSLSMGFFFSWFRLISSLSDALQFGGGRWGGSWGVCIVCLFP